MLVQNIRDSMTNLNKCRQIRCNIPEFEKEQAIFKKKLVDLKQSSLNALQQLKNGKDSEKQLSLLRKNAAEVYAVVDAFAKSKGALEMQKCQLKECEKESMDQLRAYIAALDECASRKKDKDVKATSAKLKEILKTQKTATFDVFVHAETLLKSCSI